MRTRTPIITWAPDGQAAVASALAPHCSAPTSSSNTIDSSSSDIV